MIAFLDPNSNYSTLWRSGVLLVNADCNNQVFSQSWKTNWCRLILLFGKKKQENAPLILKN